MLGIEQRPNGVKSRTNKKKSEEGRLNGVAKRDQTVAFSALTESNLQEKCRTCSGYEEKIPAKKNSQHFYQEARSQDSQKEKVHILLQMCDELLKNPGYDEHGDGELSLDSPCDALKLAEHFFERFKYSITDFVLRHEFNHDNDLSVQVTLWLEQQRQPESFSPLQNFIQQYLKNPYENC